MVIMASIPMRSTRLSARSIAQPSIRLVTDSSMTWIIVPPDVPEKGGVFDVKSGASGKALDGSEFKDW